MNRVKSALACAHHWLLSQPAGGVVTGVCKKCSARRSYPASIDEVERAFTLTVIENQDGRPAGRGRPAPVEGAAGIVI